MDPQITEPQEPLLFHEKTDTFDLSVDYTGQKLAITMKDHANLIIYSRQYTKEDVGREINRRMELIDVYTAFAQTKPQRDEEIMKEREHQDLLKKYEFGTIVEKKDSKLPCYKIDKGGKITVYLTFIDVRTNKHTTCQSNLTLSEARPMTEIEITSQKVLRLSKYELLQKSQKIKHLTQISQNLMSKIQKTTSKKPNLHQKIHQLSLQLSAKDQQIAQDQKTKDQAINLVRQKIEKNLKQIIVNKVGGDIWYSLSNLGRLDLWGCGLGRLPDDIGGLTQLVQLRLNKNELGNAPNSLTNLTYLTNLQILDLRDNNLKRLPGLLANLTNLKILYLSNNELKEIPTIFWNLVQLEQLGLGGNLFKEVPEFIGQLGNLEVLYLNNNRLEKLPDSAMVKLVKLKQLYIHDNFLTEFPISIGKLQQLQKLAIDGNKMIVDIATMIDLKKLNTLWINKCQIESSQSQQLQQHCQLNGLTLNWVQK